MNVVCSPQLPVWTGRTDFELATAQGVEEQWAAPAIDQLAFRIERGMLIGQEPFMGRISAAKCGRPILVCAQWPVDSGFYQQKEVIHQLRHEVEVIPWRPGCYGVIPQDSFTD